MIHGLSDAARHRGRERESEKCGESQSASAVAHLLPGRHLEEEEEVKKKEHSATLATVSNILYCT